MIIKKKYKYGYFHYSSSVDTSSDEDESHQLFSDSLIASKNSSDLTSFETLFPSMKEVYGTQPEYPKRNDVILYKRLVTHKSIFDNCLHLF